jgi:hypothetical protein
MKIISLIVSLRKLQKTTAAQGLFAVPYLGNPRKSQNSLLFSLFAGKLMSGDRFRETASTTIFFND